MIPSEKESLPSLLQMYISDIRKYNRGHLDLPIKVACGICKGTPAYWTHVMDFIQEGNIALLQCVETFNVQYPDGSNEEFRRYALASIRHEIYTYFARIPAIYIPRTSRKLFNERKEELCLLETCVSLEMLDIDTLQEPSTMHAAFCEAKARQVHTLLSKLPPLEKQVILLHYGIDGIAYQQKDIARLLEIGKPYVYELLHRAIKRMDGKEMRPSRIIATEKQVQERTSRLQRFYGEAQGNITVHELAQKAECTLYAAHTFLQEHRGKMYETNQGVRKEKMEILYAEWQAQGGKITQRRFARAGHWGATEAGNFLREKRQERS